MRIPYPLILTSYSCCVPACAYSCPLASMWELGPGPAADSKFTCPSSLHRMTRWLYTIYPLLCSVSISMVATPECSGKSRNATPFRGEREKTRPVYVGYRCNFFQVFSLGGVNPQMWTPQDKYSPLYSCIHFPPWSCPAGHLFIPAESHPLPPETSMHLVILTESHSSVSRKVHAHSKGTQKTKLRCDTSLPGHSGDSNRQG